MIRHLIYLYIIVNTKRYKKYCAFKDGCCINGEACCTNCKYLKNSRCSVSCVHCKIWFCTTVCKSMPKKDYIFINRLYDLASKYELLEFREPYKFRLIKESKV